MEQSTRAVLPGNTVSPWMVLSVTSLGVLLVMVNLGALNVALPAIATHFGVGAVMANWILLSYMLVNTVLILVFGQFADIFGRRNLYLLGMTVFTIVSLLIGFAPNVWVFLLLRILQAAGGALIITNNTALITDAFPEHLLGKGLSINVLVSSVAQLLGPVIGGIVASKLGWQWVFWAGVPVGAIGVVSGLVVLRNMRSSGSGEHVDWAGGITIFVALSGLIIALSEAGTLGWENTFVLAGIVVFIVLTPVVLWIERRSKAPMLDFSLFRDRPYTMANVAAFLNAFSRVSVVLLFSLYLQSVAHLDAFQAGLQVLPVTVGMLIASPIAGALSTRIQARFLSSGGLAVSAVGMILIVFTLEPGGSLVAIDFGMFLVGFGSGIFLTPNTRSIMMSVPYERRGFANGLRSMLQNMGQVMSTAISLTLVASALPSQLQDAIYMGTAAHLSHADIAMMISGYRLAFAAVLLATVLGIIASLLRAPVTNHQ